MTDGGGVHNSRVAEVTFDDGFWFDTAVLQSLAGTLDERYRTASPFPHVTIDGLFSEEAFGKSVRRRITPNPARRPGGNAR
jgi:hypothetical protein